MILALPLVLFLAVGCGTEEDGEESPDPKESGFIFEDVSETVGLDGFSHERGAFGNYWFPETMGAGAAFLDYNQDGYLDLILVNGGYFRNHREGERPALVVYRNTGHGFTDATREVGLGSVRDYGMGLTVGDYDNDGDDDFLFTTLYENRLFENVGGRFEEVTDEVGLGDYSEWSTSAIFFDANNDGWLDLYVGNYIKWSPTADADCTSPSGVESYCTPEIYEGIGPRFYINKNGRFVERTEAAGFGQSPGKTLGVAQYDYNGDGLMDLFVANDTERNELYRNEGGGTFEEVGRLAGIAYNAHGDARAGMGIDVGVLDSTGRPTMVVGHFTSQMFGVFRYQGGGTFRDRAAATTLGRNTVQTLTFGLFMFDPDLDGDLDVFAVNGHIQPNKAKETPEFSYRQEAQLFENRQGRFLEVRSAGGSLLSTPMVGRGAVYGDYDNDGDEDIVVVENGGPVHLWENRVTDSHYLRIRARGRESNRPGLGLRVRARVDERTIRRVLRGGSSYLSSSEQVVTLGLGSAGSVDTLEVRWPSGNVQTYTEIGADQTLVVDEEGGYSQIKGRDTTSMNSRTRAN